MHRFTSFAKLIFFLWLLCLWAIPSAATRIPVSIGGVAPTSETTRKFDNYISKADGKNARSLREGNFLWIDDLDKPAKEAAYAKLKRGEVIMQRITPSGEFTNIPGGMIHDWEGMIFVPGASLDDVLNLLQDYDNQSTYFAPDVQQSKIEQHAGNHYAVFLRFRRTKIITVVLNTNHDIYYFSDSGTRAHSRSSATHIAEVDNPGEPSEKEKAPGHDNGFMWRMETWWCMEERDGGVYLQNQVISLSRDIPTGLGWAIEPFVTSIPRESLEFTLSAVRRAILAKAKTN
jgi:hypothetical protein